MIDLETIEGLSTARATAQLARDGFNELAAGRIRPLWRELLDVAREPMTALLIGCGAIYFVIGAWTNTRAPEGICATASAAETARMARKNRAPWGTACPIQRRHALGGSRDQRTSRNAQ